MGAEVLSFVFGGENILIVVHEDGKFVVLLLTPFAIGALFVFVQR
jgi:hypothetical protein